MKVLMYPHGGAGNRGCEAIVRSTNKILGENEYILFSTACDQDQEVGLGNICSIKSQMQKIKRVSLGYLQALIQNRILHNEEAFDYLVHKGIFDECGKKTIALSIGGDNYCYGEATHIYLMNKYIRKKGVPNVLWGCSVEEKDITEKMEKDLKGYDLIYARESLSYETLRKINPNTKLYPDPAFQLDVKEVELPKEFKENGTVGINVSPLIMQCEKNQGITFENYCNLIKEILDTTDFSIALIPHVIWKDNDDRKPLHLLFERFKDSGRVFEIPGESCEKIKYYISKCRLFICARTHASIAAYSTCVPTLVVGYSVKARGIAKDLFGTEENYVIPVQSLKEKDDLAKGFRWLLDKEEEIKRHLETFMPEYKSRVLNIKKDIKQLMQER